MQRSERHYFQLVKTTEAENTIFLNAYILERERMITKYRQYLLIVGLVFSGLSNVEAANPEQQDDLALSGEVPAVPEQPGRLYNKEVQALEKERLELMGQVFDFTKQAVGQAREDLARVTAELEKAKKVGKIDEKDEDVSYVRYVYLNNTLNLLRRAVKNYVIPEAKSIGSEYVLPIAKKACLSLVVYYSMQYYVCFVAPESWLFPFYNAFFRIANRVLGREIFMICVALNS
jgi:hypothetical protein